MFLKHRYVHLFMLSVQPFHYPFRFISILPRLLYNKTFVYMLGNLHTQIKMFHFTKPKIVHKRDFIFSYFSFLFWLKKKKLILHTDIHIRGLRSKDPIGPQTNQIDPLSISNQFFNTMFCLVRKHVLSTTTTIPNPVGVGYGGGTMLTVTGYTPNRGQRDCQKDLWQECVWVHA